MPVLCPVWYAGFRRIRVSQFVPHHSIIIWIEFACQFQREHRTPSYDRVAVEDDISRACLPRLRRQSAYSLVGNSLKFLYSSLLTRGNTVLDRHEFSMMIPVV